METSWQLRLILMRNRKGNHVISGTGNTFKVPLVHLVYRAILCIGRSCVSDDLDVDLWRILPHWSRVATNSRAQPGTAGHSRAAGCG